VLFDTTLGATRMRRRPAPSRVAAALAYEKPAHFLDGGCRPLRELGETTTASELDPLLAEARNARTHQVDALERYRDRQHETLEWRRRADHRPSRGRRAEAVPLERAHDLEAVFRAWPVVSLAACTR
jgi:hypothetical protein